MGAVGGNLRPPLAEFQPQRTLDKCSATAMLSRQVTTKWSRPSTPPQNNTKRGICLDWFPPHHGSHSEKKVCYLLPDWHIAPRQVDSHALSATWRCAYLSSDEGSPTMSVRASLAKSRLTNRRTTTILGATTSPPDGSLHLHFLMGKHPDAWDFDNHSSLVCCHNIFGLLMHLHSCTTHRLPTRSGRLCANCRRCR